MTIANFKGVSVLEEIDYLVTERDKHVVVFVVVLVVI